MRIPKVNPVVTIPRHRPITRGEKFIFDPKVDKVEWRNPTPFAEMERRAKEYFGDDPAKFIHSSKTHRTVSEAFRDADYATPIWRCESEWDRTKEYLKWIGMWACLFFALYSLAMCFEGAMR